MTNSIESKAVLYSLLRDQDNYVLKHHTMNTAWGMSVGANVTLLELSTGDFAVCDKSTEGDYLSYLFDKETDAEVCYQTILDFIKETEDIDREGKKDA